MAYRRYLQSKYSHQQEKINRILVSGYSNILQTDFIYQSINSQSQNLLKEKLICRLGVAQSFEMYHRISSSLQFFKSEIV